MSARVERAGTVLALVAASLGCGHGVGSQDAAEKTYLGLDHAVDRALSLGMAGFNAASSANIPPQTGPGDVSGMLTVTGQVDQGASPNKQMRLQTTFANYADPVPVAAGSADASGTHLVYDSGGDAGAPPALDLSLRGIPTGTFTGTWVGDVTVSGDLAGVVTLNLAFAGTLEPVPGGDTGQIERVAGSTHITGTVTSRYGTYTVDLTR